MRLSSRVISLKIDVDTYQGMEKGVPVLLEILKKYGIKATFFLSFGQITPGRPYGIYSEGGVFFQRC
ncbi:MAG: putative 4-deoxy-4-formamido-L-arabinose-phosphoundecaprenol deformylase ArnD [Candidatus Scalindua brodae]|uniref:Putative 4-deoxy-4-formamido-L-arabinose-phosphoundecaprenol deformylase ArnD n=1 Tax=Candidatus Scalindua brodae TaxID=237368 RepID=A0A0B0EF68_9BACT|nr:MAG: putative 4-deoxy-4-formamido-L-arabinose-phosphoundecaprenol deformylase ArnD [Candidatus Scalindua brodae]